MVAESAMKLWVSCCLLFLSAIMWEALLALFPGWASRVGGEEGAGVMVELSKDKMYVIGALLLLAEHETTGA